MSFISNLSSNEEIYDEERALTLTFLGRMTINLHYIDPDLVTGLPRLCDENTHREVLDIIHDRRGMSDRRTDCSPGSL